MKKCEICGKTSMMVGRRVKLRGHYNPTGKRRKYPNLQKTRNPEGKRVLVCTDCIKAFGKEVKKMQAPAETK